jgi:hypothetical protein
MNTAIDQSQELENARVGYQVAASLWAYEGEVTWSAFNAMLVANSLVLAAEGLGSSPRWFAVVLPISGVALCTLWYLLILRGFQVHDYRVLSARELEEQYLHPTVQTVSRGAAFHAGREVSFRFRSDDGKLQLTFPLGIDPKRGKQVASMVIGIFAALHVLSIWR